MKRAILLLAVAMPALSNQVAAQAKLVEKITRQGDELVIPYEKYVLPNGLTLVVAEDHSDPVVQVDVTYHVGSAREQIGKSGFAHFFEQRSSCQMQQQHHLAHSLRLSFEQQQNAKRLLADVQRY